MTMQCDDSCITMMRCYKRQRKWLLFINYYYYYYHYAPRSITCARV